MLPVRLFEALCEEEQFIGIKDDIYILDNRIELVRKFSERMGITGGGMFSHYIFFHHWPNQGEFAGIFNPQRGQRMFELLDENNYLEVLKMMETDAQSGLSLPGIHWMARNQVVVYGMEFAETYLMRPPIASATEEQARAIIEHMRRTPTLFERVAR
jgi:dihydrodipicolinate synthase/N-acetylneuraminate lyase